MSIAVASSSPGTFALLPAVAASAPSVCVCCDEGACECSLDERALRAFGQGEGIAPQMTAQQREECLAEIGRVEGYKRTDYEGVSDAQLANGVMQAWSDFCRDTGLM